MRVARPKASFLAFFLAWSELKGWEVPALHVRVCHWLEHRGRHAVLRIPRGCAKSTILAVYNAWRYWIDPSYRILHQGDQDKTAYKTSRDTQAVLRRHPWTSDWATGLRGEASFWWTPDADDERNPSMQAAGITSNITSSRCDEAQNDDVEVPRNIQNPEAREKMRYRLGEQVHIMVPGARLLFVGTPHTHDSIYDEHEAMGADCLTIRMFGKEQRIEQATRTSYRAHFKPDLVFAGIGKHARWLKEGKDYSLSGGFINFTTPPGCLVDLYAECVWVERFTHAELFERRQKTRTINEWDSQYQLHSRPVHDTRLNPAQLVPYDVAPRFETRNRKPVMLLGEVQIVGATVQWDPSSGKQHSDVSALAVVLFDEYGNRYWHSAVKLLGEVAEFDEAGKVIVGGQVLQIVETVKALQLRRVVVETNGAGTFAPAVLKACLKQHSVHCGVTSLHETRNKNRTILEAIEGPLVSGKLWAHVDVVATVSEQMRDWKPDVSQQPDDFLDSAAKALTQAPERVGGLVRTFTDAPANDWRPSAGVFEAELEL